ncbi:apoptotic protease-activating factor 1-like isoform X2 [Phymastichus coffea]|uniref:apoptotic protease-activating factor 1-like isoform X2 n=1 Tax=Phymastichus coffea TaxID=108790 RepID=UPI00273AEF66|nr:apoptotic protease-activating factor 1-like isoform X2 [Phymastichus coffea]
MNKVFNLPFIMDQRHKDILSQMRQNIIDDLDVYNGIIGPLSTEFVLKSEDVENINKGKTKQEKAEILLDLLPQQGSNAFDVFHQSLKHHYDWLSEKIDKMLAAPGTPNNERYIVNPNLQPVSPITVAREDMLKDALQKLQPNEYVALHGMKGFGKSCLTASTLKDKNLSQKLFNNEIYWIKFGYKLGLQEEILIQLNNLYHQIKCFNYLQETVNSESLEKTLKQTIENYFWKENHRNALLILDDVYRKEFVDKFDFACKTLVITSDIGVLYPRSYSIVAMNHGFTKAETLGLFAKVLDASVDTLPPQANLIHEECKGMPLLIAMFAAQFENYKHDMKWNTGRWNYYLKCLRTKNAKNKVIEEFMKIQEATFDMCINQLDPEMKERYEHLVIFSEDVNIMPKTLEILWDEEPYSVDDQMLDFCHKSLAAKKWNDDLKSYIYGVHDLLLCHLRKKLTPTQIRDKHRLFIEKYRKYCNGDFSKLPDDNYSFSYIGHHLEQAELFDDFPAIFMNFDFIQAKINNTGLSDLLIDLKKYRKHITKNGDEKIESDLSDMEQFVKSHASTLAKHRQMKCLDLVQIALDHSADGFVKNTITNLALSRPNSLYISHERTDLFNIKCYSNFCQEITDDVHTAVFTEDPSHVLIGSNSGEIILWDTDNHKSKIFSGHNKKYAIKKIVLSMAGDYFLALSEDGTIKMFVLNENEFTRNGLSISIQNPRHKQSSWKNLFKTTHDDSVRTFAIDQEHISDMKFSLSNNKVAACTTSGTLAVWDAQTGILELNDKLRKETGPNRLGGVAFTTGDKFLHVLNETISVVRIYKKNQDKYIYVSQFNLQLTNPRVIYFSKHPEEDNCLVIVTDKVALYLKWFVNIDELSHSYEKLVKIEEKEENVYFTTATLTYDARYLIIGNSKGIISIVKAFNPDDFITGIKANVTSLDSYWMPDERCHMVCGGEKCVIYNWKIGDDEKPKIVKELLFDARVQNFGEDNIIVLKTAPNEITICNGIVSPKRIESECGKITSIELRDNATKLIYITELASVVIYDMLTQETTRLSQLNSFESYIGILQINDNYVVLCQNNHQLQVWKNIKSSHSVEDAIDVIFVHKIKTNWMMTVSKKGQIKYLYTDYLPWKKIDCKVTEEWTIVYSTISNSKTLLAILSEEQNVIIYKLPDVDTEDSSKVESFMKYEYKSQLSICQFSHDGKYLAVALDNGEISIIDVDLQCELGKLCLHCCPVSQLNWSPSSISVPILLSVNCDELAWWNVSMLHSIDKTQNRRSRMGFSRSINNLNMDMSQTRMSQSVKRSKLQINVDEFWSRKLAKSNRPAMLGCVQLPSTCTGKVKVCVSEDFSKFLTIDIHGTVSNFTIFGNLD